MTLPIADSMLRGDLRRQILSTLKTEKEISLLWRDLSKSTAKCGQSLMAIEQALIRAVEESGLVQVSAEYKDDRGVRHGAEKARDTGMCFGETYYTRVDGRACFDGVFNPIAENTPTDKFLHLLLKVECTRTMEAMLMLVKSVHDDAVVRTYVRKLFSMITSICKDGNDLFVKETMTQFYFEIYHTFKGVLEKSGQQAYETDFENFVFEWKGEFPEEEVLVRYNEKVGALIPVAYTSDSSISSKQDLHEQAKHVRETPKDKYDLFLEAANNFSFSEMPKVKELGTSGKIRQLVERMLEQKNTVSDTFGHTAAWLEYLGFYKWIGEKHVSGYKLTQFDSWCTEHIMNKSAGTAFRHYRLSVNVKPDDDGNVSYKYLGWKYKTAVAEEYRRILEG